jgi:cytoskeletal protein RodZ
MGNTFVVKLKKRREKSLSLIVLIMLLAILGYLGYRIVPVYLAQEAFQEDLLYLAGRAALDQQDNRTITEQVVELCQARHFSIQEENIRIQRIPENPEVGIVVDYTKTTEFPGGYVYVFHLRSEAQGLL